MAMKTRHAATVLVAMVLCSGAARAQGGYSVVNSGAGAGAAPAVTTVSAGTPAPAVAPGAPTGSAATNPSGAIGVMPSAAPEARITRRDVPDGRVRRPEEYGGLSPGMPALHRGLRRMLGLQRNSPSPVVAWPGFQMVPGGSRLFLAMTRPVTVLESTPRPMERVLHLDRARILRTNHRRPLETVAFDTPLVRAVLRPSRGGLDLVMQLRADAALRTSQEAGNDGMHFLYVDFPPYTLSEVARIQMPNGQTVIVGADRAPLSNAPPTAAPPPGMATPVSTGQGPAVDTETPPPVQR